MSVADREDSVYQAKLAEQAERYDEMAKYMKDVATTHNEPLGTEERNLLSVAYKNIIGARRAAYRVLTSLADRVPDSSSGSDADRKKQLLDSYILKIDGEIRDKATEVIDLVTNHVLGKEPETTGQVFYTKMCGDYYRYIAEISKGSERVESVSKAEEFYKQAQGSAQTLRATDPIRLGLVLNMSVFYYEIMGDPGRACLLAKEGFDNAMGELDGLRDDSYKDTTLILGLIRDNMTLWSSETEDRDEDN